jgi:cytochrome b pre-mRNA-processing protein 3
LRQYIELPEPNATVATSIPPVSPSSAKEGSKASTAHRVTPLLKPNKFTTYTTYGIAEVLYKECASRANYKIEPREDDSEVPKTEDGEELGIGDSWWHTGKVSPSY